MTIEQYWNILLKRWKLIVFCIIITALVAYAGSRLATPVYQSTAIVQVTLRSGNSQADINSLLASNQLVQTEAQLAVSDPVLRDVATRYPHLTVEQISKKVTAAPKPNTQLFDINILDSNPAQAANLANDIAKTLIKQQLEVSQQDYSQIRQQLQSDLKQTQSQIDTVAKKIESLRNKNSQDVKLNIQEANLDDLRQQQTHLQALLTEIELKETQNDKFLRLAQPAQRSTKPVQPNIPLNTIIGLLVGLLNGLILTMIFEQLDTRVRTEETLSHLVDWAILAVIWRQHVSKKGRKQRAKGERWKADKYEVGELLNPTTNDAYVESYRMLRTNIGFSMVRKPLRSIAVVSATSHDGKSLIAANLAIFMAKSGKKTLLIDADLRRPTLYKRFHLSEENIGLTNAIMDCNKHYTDATLAGHAIPSLDAYTHEIDIPNLKIMPSGPLPPNPPELLDSKIMDHFFTALSQSEAEIIIFDTPPLIGLSDTNILLPHIDSALIVIDITSATKKNLQRVDKLLHQSGSHILGCVINKQTPNHKDSVYSYSYKYMEYDTKEQPAPTSPVSQPEETPIEAEVISLPASQRGRKKRKVIIPELTELTKTTIQQEEVETADNQQQAYLQLFPSEGFVTLPNNLHLYYRICGNGPEVILVPTASWLIADFEPLTQNHTVIFYDQRGRGQSDTVRPPEQISIQHELEDLEEVRQFFKLTDFSLVGWSYQGGVAALYAMKHPAYVKRLLLIGSIPLRSHSYEETLSPQTEARVDPHALKQLEQMRKEGLERKDPALYNRKLAKAVRMPRQMGNPAAIALMKSDPWQYKNEWSEAITAFYEQIAQSLQEWDWRKQISVLKMPILVIHGTEDLIPLNAAREWATLLPNARLLPMTGVGHYPWLEQPELFFGAIAHFMHDEWPQASEAIKPVGATRKPTHSPT